MAKSRKKSDKPTKNDELYDILQASLHGLSPEFLRKNDKVINDVRKVLSDKLATGNVDTDSKTGGENDFTKEYVKLIAATINKNQKMNIVKDQINNEKIGDIPTKDGLMTLSSGNNETTELEEFASNLSNHFSLMSEYAKVVELIPELTKAVEMVVKDLINRDEFSNKFIQNFYTSDEDDTVRSNAEKIIVELLEEYQLESKVPTWFKESEISGAKPISILPSEDIIELINNNLKRFGVENFDIDDSFDEEEFLIPSQLDSAIKSYDKLRKGEISTESEDYRMVLEDASSIINRYTDEIITQDIINDYEDMCMENIDHMFEEEYAMTLSIEDSTDIIKSKEVYYKELSNPKYRAHRSEILKNKLRDIVVDLDRSVEVVDPMKAPLYEAKKSVSMNKYGPDLIDPNDLIDDFYKIKTGKSFKDKTVKSININGIEVSMTNDGIDIDEYNKVAGKRRAILTEYDPEYVIPISSGNTHIGYYVIEYRRLEEEMSFALTKNRGSFADIIRKLGVGDDSVLLNGYNNNSIVNGNPFNTPAFDSSFSLAATDVINRGKNTNDNQSSSKSRILKGIMMRIVSKRLKDKKLVDNAAFQSGLLNVLKDDLFFRNKIRFTFIPASHMVYFNRELNGKGMPVSIFSGTLFNIYMYLSSVISSLMTKIMKSSDTEVMRVNIGKSKELGLTIGNINKHASTRNISAKHIFGGTANIISSVGNYKRLIVPVINGETLFDVSQIEKVNDIDIDDEFTDKLLKSIVMKIGVPPSSLDMLSEDEYVASQMQHRIDYRNLIIDKGVHYSDNMTKLIRLIVYYSDIDLVENVDGHVDRKSNNKKNSNIESTKIDINDINFKFVAPKNLTVSKVGEELGEISDLVDKLIDVYFGEIDGDNKEFPVFKAQFKKLLIKALSSSTDWTLIDDIFENAGKSTPEEFAKWEKFNIETKDVGEDNDGY